MSEISTTERRAALQSGLNAVIAGLLEDLREELRLKHRRVDRREETKLARRPRESSALGCCLLRAPPLGASCACVGMSEAVSESIESAPAHDSEAGSGEDEEEYLAPVVDGRNITFQTSLVNRFLSCPLCHGYLREPYTITECIHSFCKVCIYMHYSSTASSSHSCPVCGEHLGPNPHDRTLPDRQLASLMAKILPEIVAEDLKAEEEFYRSRGLKRPGSELPAPPPPPQKVAPPAPKVPRPPSAPAAAAAAKAPPDDVSFQLILDERDPALINGLVKLEKPLITTSRRVTMTHIKRFLLMKLKEMTVDQIDLLYQGEVLGGEHTLDFVLKRNPPRRGDIPVLNYRRKKLDVGLF